MKRWFQRFGPRLQEQLNIVAGVVAVGALILALAGFVTSGIARTLLIAAGALIAVTMVVVGVAKAWPPPDRSPSDVEGQDLPVADLESIYPAVPAVGVLGVGGVGKTTLEHRLLQESTRDLARTQKVTFRVSALLRDPTTYLALLDGRGESFAQQFQVAEHADILLVLCDHNDIEGSTPNPDRLVSQQVFGNQLRDYLQNQSTRRGPVHLLLNKRDLWEAADSGAQDDLRAFFLAEVAAWQAAFGNSVTSAEHSNDSPNDVAALILILKEQWKEAQRQRQ